MTYYITKKHLKSNNQGETGIPKGTLVRGRWDSRDSWFKVSRAIFSAKPNETNSVTMHGGATAKERLREVYDYEIEAGLKAIGLLEADDKMEEPREAV